MERLMDLLVVITKLLDQRKLINQNLCLDSAMSKDQSGVAELLSAKHGAIRASVFRHSRHMAPQVSSHCVHMNWLAGADQPSKAELSVPHSRDPTAEEVQ